MTQQIRGCIVNFQKFGAHPNEADTYCVRLDEMYELKLFQFPINSRVPCHQI